ncbi:MAG: urease subunit beta [Terriglobales bacterium]|jgi:urease beta subunit
MKPGEYLLDLAAGSIEANKGRKVSRVIVKNTGDRPIQVGSHYHFLETNTSLSFDRGAAYGMRLNIASGTAVRFEPGEEKEVELTDFGGHRIIHGFHNLVAGVLDDARSRAESLDRARKAGFSFHEGGKKR